MKANHQVAKVHPQSYWSVEFDKDVVCVPSLTFDRKEVEKVAGHVHYEERQLFNLILLKNPHVRLFYVTSVPIGISIIEYYLSLLDLSLNDVKDRLIFLSTHDSSPIPLTQKILDRPKLMERIKKAIRPEKAIMLAFNSTPLECTLAAQLGITAFGNCAGTDHWGSKSGSREVFLEAEIPCAKGTNLTRSLDELADNIAELCVQDASVHKMMVKLDQGFSGNGNAYLILDRSVAPSREWALKALEKMEFSCPQETWEGFSGKIEALGVIAEVFFDGESPKSPSVQASIDADGHVEILSTHEQILNGQVYLGCNFPASESYRGKLHEYGRRVGKVLASKGVRGHYGVDFLVQATDKNDPSKTSDEIFAIEINLRQCGTTHPFFTMKLLTGGTYDKKSGLFLGANNKYKYYAASDNLHKENYIGLVPEDIIDMSKDHEFLRYDKTTERGPVFHLLGSLSQHGKVGLTCIGDSPEDAMKIMKRVEALLDSVTPPTTPVATPSIAQQQSEANKTTEKLKETAIRMIPIAQAAAVAM